MSERDYNIFAVIGTLMLLVTVVGMFNLAFRPHETRKPAVIESNLNNKQNKVNNITNKISDMEDNKQEDKKW